MSVTSPVAPGGVGGERPEALGLGEAAPAGREHDGARRDRQTLASLRRPSVARHPDAVVSSASSGAWSSVSMRASDADRLAQGRRDGVAGAVTDLQQSLARRAAAAREPVAAVGVVRERDAEALEPRDRVRRLRGQRGDEARVGRLVRALHDVLGVHRRRVVVAERRLDAALRLGRVGGREPELRREHHARAGIGGRERGRQPGHAGADHEDVAALLGHADRLVAGAQVDVRCMSTTNAGSPLRTREQGQNMRVARSEPGEPGV